MKKTKITIVLIFIVAICAIIIGISNKTKTFKEINIKDENQDNTLAIMIRDEKDKEYKKQNRLEFPNKDNYRYIGSTCTDNEGNILNGKEYIRYDEDTNKAYLTTNKAVHCSMFFADALPASEQIVKYSSKYLEPEQDVTDRGDVLRRFQGTVEKNADGTIDETNDVNNYVCFGTTDKEECVSNTDKYMYRIIGYAIDDDMDSLTYKGQLKLIKKEALEKTMVWNDDRYTYVPYYQTIPYLYINGEGYLNNDYYVLDSWKDEIVNHNWTYGNNNWTYDNKTLFQYESAKLNYVFQYLNVESGNKTRKVENTAQSKYAGQNVRYDEISKKWDIILSKVGMLYLTDNSLAAGKETNGCYSSDTNEENKNICQKGWLNLNNNDTNILSFDSKNPLSNMEHIVNIVGYAPKWGYYDNFALRYDGLIISANVEGLISVVRPVIYITQDIFLMGTGTQSDPYRIISPDLN